MGASIKEVQGIDLIKEKGLDYGRNCITGGEIHLLNELQESFKKAKSVDLIVSFLMESMTI